MAENFFKPRGTLNAYKPESGGAFVRSAPVFGIVKDNVDSIRAGRIKVYISDFSNLDPDNSSGWVTVGYMSNFFGSVRPTSSSEGPGTYKHNPSSYGEWHAPPDIGTTVICIFIQGDVNKGFYIGCVPDPETLHMVPAIGSNFSDQGENIVCNNDSEASTYGGAPRLPTTNMNTNNSSETDDPEFITSNKPVHSYTAAIMEQQGIIRDPIRGPISSSAQRETSSRVGWGVSTPGRPIYEGGYDDENISENNNLSNAEKLRIISRRGGHSFVMDDGDIAGRDQLVRIRTAKGHQILMSDDGQTLMILHSNGQSYVELGKEGTVDVYSTNSINLRTQGDLNLHADNNLNIHAAKDLNIHAENMNVTTQKSLNQSIGLNWITSALGLITAKTVGAMSLHATGIASFSSTALTFINGGLLNLNTGKSPIKPLSPTTTPLTAHTDTLFDQQKGFSAAPGKLLSVTSRAPAHAPWVHAGQGVDLKTDFTGGSGGGGLSSALSSVVSAGLSSIASPVKLATALSSVTTSSISKNLTSAATSSLVGLTGQNAALGPLASAINKGAAIVNVGTQKIAAVGAFAQNPTQMVNAGVLKPGSDRLINSLVSSGANITQSMTNTLFTGAPGAETLTSYTKSVESQTTTVVTNLQRSQTILTNSGVITGTESAGQIAGVVFSGANSGIANTISAVRTTVNKNTFEQSVIRDIGAATVSVQSAETTIGGMGGIAQAVEAMSVSPVLSGSPREIGGSVVNSAFSAISGSFPTFKTNEPINLATAVSGQQVVADTLSSMTGQITTDITSKLTPNAIKTSALTIANKFTGTSILQSTNIASGIINIPGGISSIASFTNKALPPGLSSIPGAGQISSLVNNAATSALNGLTSGLTGGLSGGLSGLTSGLSGGLSGLTGGLSGGLSGLTSGLSGGLSGLTGGLSGLTGGLSSIGSLAGAFSAISAVKSLFGRKGGVRMPSVAVNTANRAPLTQKILSLLGDPGIPSPTFTGENNRGSSTNARTSQNDARMTALRARLNALRVEDEKLKQEIQALPNNALPGDPKFEEIRNRLLKVITEQQDILKELG
jgi:hypothetical protein